MFKNNNDNSGHQPPRTPEQHPHDQPLWRRDGGGAPDPTFSIPCPPRKPKK